ncbi:MAG: serine hydrolase domain-containing protein [Acutalibacter sp.]|jgi:hypothetical protein
MRREFERVTPESVGVPTAAVNRLLDRLEESQTEMHGLMVMRHGKVCAEGWWTPYAPGLRHGLQSLSKTYAATGVGLLYTEGLIRLDERVIDIFPEDAPADPSENLQKLTVRDVLCMGNGMDTMPSPSEHWIRDFLHTPVTHEPGSCFMYNSVGSSLLAAMVVKKTGQSLQEYLTPRLYEKLGIDPASTGWYNMPDGVECGGAGMFSTTENNLRLMKLYADGGLWEGERILAEDYVKLATSAQNDSSTEAKGNPEAYDNFMGYGFQIWMCRPRGVYRADGAMGQFSVVVPDKDMIISINETATGAHWAQNTLDILWQFLGEIPEEDPLPEDSQVSDALRRRMSALSLPNPPFTPESPVASQVSGQWYALEQGSFTLRQRIGGILSGTPVGGEITRFRLDFSYGSVMLTALEDGKEVQYRVAVDGTRALNLVETTTLPVSRLYLHGWWSGEDTFSIALRWVETCFEDRLDLHFVDGGVELRRESVVGGFGPMTGKGETLLAKRC